MMYADFSVIPTTL